MSGPVVIGHRGASGHRPEHSSLAYRLAWRSGADSVEPDVVSTRDGVLVCRHDLDLDRTTDVARRPAFAGRRRRMVLEGREVRGWFVQDFDLAELRELRVRERWPRKRPESARFDGQVGLVTLEELLVMRRQESERAGRRLGVHIELKHPELFARLGMPLHEPLVELLRRHDLAASASAASVMSFDAAVLGELRRHVDTGLVQLVGRATAVKRGRLQRIAAYADAVGLHKAHVIPRGGLHDGRTRPRAAVRKALGAQLDVLCWTLREESPHDVARLFDLGVDGVLTDFPALAVQARSRRSAAAQVS